MRFPLVTRAKYDRQLEYANGWREKLQVVEMENAGLKALLSQAYRKLAPFERRRGQGGKFESMPG